MPLPGADKADLAVARKLLRHGSHSFFAASLLLPRHVGNSAMALYAFCRVADDAIDFGTDRQAELARLTARLDAVYRASPEPGPVDRAFAATVAAHGIPHALPAALIDGLAWDAAGRRYQTFPELLDYAARVAGSVGIMMALVMGVRDPAALGRAAELGMAMQLTNIARDVGEDARAGRVYLPLDWLAEAGIATETFLAAPAHSPQLAAVIGRLLDQADLLYASGSQGLSHLPLTCRPGIAAARSIYAAIGRQIAAAGNDSITTRAYVATSTKLLLLARATLTALAPRRAAETVPLPQTEFMLAAVPPRPVFAAQTAISSVEKILTLFERLERAQREDRRREGNPA
jgi:phytoene synthase